MAGKKFPLEILIGALDNATGPLKQINAQIDQIREPVGRLQKAFGSLNREAGLGRLKRSLGEVHSAAGGMSDGIARIGHAIFWLGGTAIAAGYAFDRFIQSSAQTLDTLAKLSEATGVSTEAIQTLGYASQIVGVSQEDFTKSFSKFTKTMGELKAGTGSLFSFLRMVDPAFLRVLQRTDKTEDGFRKFIERLHGVKNESARVALAMAGFGRSGGMMANLAHLSTKELAALENQMRSIGLVSSTDAKNAEAFADSWSRVKFAIENVKLLIAAKFFPVLTQLSEQFVKWVGDNRPRIDAFAKQLASQLPQAAELLLSALEKIMSKTDDVLKVFKFLEENTWLVKAALVALSAYIVGPFLVSTFMMIKALAGLSVTLLATPLGWFLVALAAVSVATYEVIDNWKLLKSIFTDVFDWMISKMNKWLELIDKVINFAHQIPVIGQAFATDANSPQSIVNRGLVPSGATSTIRDSKVKVTFENTPKGTRVEQDNSSDGADLDVGYQFAGAW